MKKFTCHQYIQTVLHVFWRSLRVDKLEIVTFTRVSKHFILSQHHKQHHHHQHQRRRRHRHQQQNNHQHQHCYSHITMAKHSGIVQSHLHYSHQDCSVFWQCDWQISNNFLCYANVCISQVNRHCECISRIALFVCSHNGYRMTNKFTALKKSQCNVHCFKHVNYKTILQC